MHGAKLKMHLDVRNICDDEPEAMKPPVITTEYFCKGEH
jgi:hypothetical protein